jgi:hypothetical protein
MTTGGLREDLETVRQGRRGRLAELAADLNAAAIRSDASVNVPAIDVPAVHSRPAILRRIAALLAEQLPPGIDRLVGAEADGPLVTAVALHIGLPFALATAATGGSGVFRGDLYPFERVALIETVSSGEAVSSLLREDLLRRLEGNQIELAVVCGAIRLGPREAGADALDQRWVYRLSEHGLDTFQEEA